MVCWNKIHFNTRYYANSVLGPGEVEGGDADIRTIMSELLFTINPKNRFCLYYKTGIGIVNISNEKIKIMYGDILGYWHNYPEQENGLKVGVSVGGGMQINFHKSACVQLGINYLINIGGNQNTQILPVTFRLLF